MAQEENIKYDLREVCGRTSRLGKPRSVQEHRDEEKQTYNQGYRRPQSTVWILHHFLQWK